MLATGIDGRYAGRMAAAAPRDDPSPERAQPDPSPAGETADKAGASAAESSGMPKSITFEMTCATVVMIVEPPGVPTTRKTAPSLTTIVGVMADSMRLPGSITFALPWTSP